MLNNATSMISLKKLQQNSVKVKEVWCTEQEDDFKRMIAMIDDLVSHAISVANSPHSYFQLESAKENFLQEFLDMAEKYRLPQT